MTMLLSLLLGLQMVDRVFTYVAPVNTKQVCLAGTFNGFDAKATPMHEEPDGVTWTKSMHLAAGVYQYKFVVDGQWFVDPKAEKNVDDGSGHTNSQITILPADYLTPATVGDGVIASSPLEHFTSLPDVNFDRGQLILKLRTRPNDIAQVLLETKSGRSIPLVPIGGDDIYETYEAKITWDRQADFDYNFKLVDGPLTEYFGPNGVSARPEGNYFSIEAKTFKPFVVPAWVEHSVIYQIFPDRFENGDKSNDPADVVPWNAKPTFSNHFGGDFAGVKKHIDYLKDLGISCIYFNPIFESHANHRYETDDYHKVDHELGSNQEFDSLTKDLKSAGIRTVLDGVFNHTSIRFAPFNDVVQHGASSPYVDWYTFHAFPVVLGDQFNYEGWYGYASLPKLHHANAEVQKYIYNVPKFWSDQADIGGWRLDAAEQVPLPFWQGFRKAVKAISPDEWIVGEFWGDANPWLKGDAWDSCMNYQFCFATWGFVGKEGDGKPSTYMKKLMGTYASYPPQVSRNLMNLIDSHDTVRVLNQCNENRSLADLAAVLEFSWVGTPTIYYGDEIGMDGGKDPDDRRPMAWQTANNSNPTLQLYKKLIAARKASPELQSGDPIALLTDDRQQLVAFGRVLDGKAAITIVNRSDGERTAVLPTTNLRSKVSNYIDSLSGNHYRTDAEGKIEFRLKPYQAVLLLPSDEAISLQKELRKAS